MVGNEHEVRGLLAVRDRARASARQTIASLRTMGGHVAKLTGDSARTSGAVAQVLGIEVVRVRAV